jgi:lactoylglutathione lyase
MLVKIIGLVAAILTTSAFLPQVIKTWKTRSTEDLSPVMFVLFFIGIVCWLIYGCLIKDIPIIIANSATICLAGTILFFIIKRTKDRHIEHLGIYTDDIEAMKSFYIEVFNARAGKLYLNQRSNFSSYFIYFNSGCRVELMKLPGSGHTKGWGHIALSVGSKEEVIRITEKIRLKGFEVFKEPRVTGDGYYESVIIGPDGNEIEITI